MGIVNARGALGGGVLGYRTVSLVRKLATPSVIWVPIQIKKGKGSFSFINL